MSGNYWATFMPIRKVSRRYHSDYSDCQRFRPIDRQDACPTAETIRTKIRTLATNCNHLLFQYKSVFDEPGSQRLRRRGLIVTAEDVATSSNPDVRIAARGPIATEGYAGGFSLGAVQPTLRTVIHELHEVSASVSGLAVRAFLI